MPPAESERRGSPPLTLPGLSTDNEYGGPDANMLAALLCEEKPVRSHEVEFNSRESTPLVMAIPTEVDHWRSVARAARDNLASSIGESAANKIRESIKHTHYWKTEAEHYAASWSSMAAGLTGRPETLRPTTSEYLRRSISDRHYWQTEALHYERYAGVTNCYPAAAPKPKPSTTAGRRPSGVSKKTKAPQHKLKVKLKDSPVSSRLRSSSRSQSSSNSRSRSFRKMAPEPKYKKRGSLYTCKAPILPHMQRPRRR